MRKKRITEGKKRTSPTRGTKLTTWYLYVPIRAGAATHNVNTITFTRGILLSGPDRGFFTDPPFGEFGVQEIIEQVPERIIL